MGIKTVPFPPYSPDLSPCDFWLFPKLRVCRYETIEEMKEAVMKVIDVLTQEDFHGALQKFFEWYNKCIAAEGDYFKGDKSFMCVLSIKEPIWKMSYNILLLVSQWYPDRFLINWIINYCILSKPFTFKIHLTVTLMLIDKTCIMHVIYQVCI